MSFRLVVLVSGKGTNLQAILDRLHGREGIEVVGVASNRPEARGLERAARAGVETAVFSAADFPDRERRDAALGDWIEGHSADLVVLAGFTELLSAPFVSRFEGRIVNVHPSLLPSFPGIDAIERALEHGVRVTGVTVHFVDEGIDSGPIVLQEPLELRAGEGRESLESRLHAIEHELFPRAIRLIAAGAVRFDPVSPRRVTIEDDGGG